MRLLSTPESVAHGEPSVLAIVETLFAMSVTIYIAVHFGTLKWIAFSACIAPFLLLRTDRSIALGIHVADRIHTKIERLDFLREYWPHPDFLLFCLQTLLCSVSVPIIRFLVTAIVAIRHPLEALKAAPANWFRITLCLDLHRAPEILPEYDRSEIARWKFSDLVDSFRYPMHLPTLERLLALTFGVLFFLPPLFYRLSLKSTSVLYLPLLWIVLSTFRTIFSVQSALERIRRTDASRIITIYSLVVLLSMAVKVVCMVGWGPFFKWVVDSTEIGRLAGIYIQPAAIPLWQVSASINSMIAVGLFVFAGEILFRIEHDEPWSETFVERLLRSTAFIRCVLTLYTISCTLYITIRAASDWDLPRLGTKLFPWL